MTRLTIKRLEAIIEALVKLDPKNRRVPDRHHDAAGQWAVQELARRRARRKEPPLF